MRRIYEHSAKQHPNLKLPQKKGGGESYLYQCQMTSGFINNNVKVVLSGADASTLPPDLFIKAAHDNGALKDNKKPLQNFSFPLSHPTNGVML